VTAERSPRDLAFGIMAATLAGEPDVLVEQVQEVVGTPDTASAVMRELVELNRLALAFMARRHAEVTGEQVTSLQVLAEIREAVDHAAANPDDVPPDDWPGWAPDA
jgi:hypothetical protein